MLQFSKKQFTGVCANIQQKLFGASFKPRLEGLMKFTLSICPGIVQQEKAACSCEFPINSIF